MHPKKIGLVTGPLVFILTLMFFHPEGMGSKANAILAATLWIAIWWITEAIPIAVTALLPIILFPLSGGSGFFKKSRISEKKFCPRQRSCPGQVASSKKSDF